MYCPKCSVILIYVNDFPGRWTCDGGHLWDYETSPMTLREVLLQPVALASPTNPGDNDDTNG